jgi:hypothetical protein
VTPTCARSTACRVGYPAQGGPSGGRIWLGLVAFVPGVLGLGGILGGAGQALALLEPGLRSIVGTALVATVTVLFLASGSYVGLERVMLALVGSFTLATLVCSITMQFTEFGVSTLDLAAGFAFDFPAEYLALAVYGYTGVDSGEIAAYTENVTCAAYP